MPVPAPSSELPAPCLSVVPAGVRIKPQFYPWRDRVRKQVKHIVVYSADGSFASGQIGRTNRACRMPAGLGQFTKAIALSEC